MQLKTKTTVFILLFLPFYSLGQKRVAVLEFKGIKAIQIREAILNALIPKVNIIAQREVIKTAKELGVDLNQREGLKEVATQIGIDAFVLGKIQIKRKRFKITLRIHNGREGKVIKRTTLFLPVRRFSLLETFAKKAIKKILPAINRAKGPPEAEMVFDVIETEPEEEEPVPGLEDTKKEEEEEEEETNCKEGIDCETPWDLYVKRELKFEDFLDIEVGIGILSRNFFLPYEPEDRPSEGDKKYIQSFPEVQITISALPIAIFSDSFINNLGLKLQYARGIAIPQAQHEKNNEKDIYNVGKQSFDGDIFFKWQIRERFPSVKLTLLVGYELFEYSLDQVEGQPNRTPYVRTFRYQSLKGGLETEVNLFRKYISGFVGGAYKYVLDFGPGERYGKRILLPSYEIKGGINGNILYGLYYRLTIEYLCFLLDFRKKDRSEGAGFERGQDQYVRLILSLGYHF
jgi:hypothetical protein